ncbi:MAG: VCBS repeat-containing protein [Acidobacteria bacterium]|nr:VCBS repeat-containing protein [Acidobacteriota bacterium]
MRGWLALAIPLIAWPQVCPPIRFVSAAEAPASGRAAVSFVSALQRLADGSYNELRYQTFAPFTKLSTTSNAQELFYKCSARPRPAAPQPGPQPRIGDTLGLPSTEILVTDLAGDGTSAILSTYAGRFRQLFVALGAPDLSPRGSTFYDAGQDPEGVLSADFNGDGKRDVGVVYFGDQRQTFGGIAILLGNGDGTLRPAVLYRNPVNAAPISGAAGDFNGDGRADVALGNYTGDIAVYLAQSDGSLRAPVVYKAGTTIGAIAVADVNGDSRGDLIAVGDGGRLAILLGNGDGTFRDPILSPAPFRGSYIAVGDFNKDRRVDLVIADRLGGAMWVLLGNGVGSFQVMGGYLTGNSPGFAYATDFDSDGNLDVSIATGDPNGLTANTYSGNISILFGKGDGSFWGAPAYSVGQFPATISAADLNGDGKPDLFTPSFSGTIHILLGQGGERFQALAPLRIPAPFQAILTSVIAADFNRDGRADLVAADESNNSIWVLTGNGDGTFQAAVRHATGPNPGHTVAADFNGDGRLDLAVANNGLRTSGSSGSVSILLATAANTFQPAVNLTVGPNPVRLATADLNGDGRTDLIVLNRGMLGSTTVVGNLAVLLGNGNGTFQAPVTYAAGRNPASFALGDVNGDRRNDVVVYTGTPGQQFGYSIATLIGRPDGTFSPPSYMNSDFGPSGIAIADFSGDAKADLVVAHCCGDTDMTFHIGNGDGTFQPEVHFPAGDSPDEVVVADFNLDGKPDLAVSHTSSSQSGLVSIFLNASSRAGPLTSVSGASFMPGPVAPESIVAAFGSGLATETRSNEDAIPPTRLAGTSVSVRDSAGTERAAPLFSVSPGLVNYLMPAGTATGTATATVTSGDGAVSSGTVQVAPVAPGVFPLNSDRLAAAVVLRVTEDGAQKVEQVYEVDAGGQIVSLPVDLGPETDQVFLLLYATGLHFRSGLSAVRVTMGGQEAEVSYAGAQGSVLGLDQVNLRIPRTLVGRGDVDIELVADGKAANTTRIRVK